MMRWDSPLPHGQKNTTENITFLKRVRSFQPQTREKKTTLNLILLIFYLHLTFCVLSLGQTNRHRNILKKSHRSLQHCLRKTLYSLVRCSKRRKKIKLFCKCYTCVTTSKLDYTQKDLKRSIDLTSPRTTCVRTFIGQVEKFPFCILVLKSFYYFTHIGHTFDHMSEAPPNNAFRTYYYELVSLKSFLVKLSRCNTGWIQVQFLTTLHFLCCLIFV